MARKLTEIPSVAAKRTIDPYFQPAFALYTYHYSWGAGYYTYDHNFNLMGQHYGDGDASYGEFRTQGSGSREFFESGNSYEDVRTNEYPGSSYSYMCNSTWANGYGGHQSHSSPTLYSIECGIQTGNADGLRYRRHVFNRDVFTIPGHPAQDFAILGEHDSSNGPKFSVGPRSQLIYYSQMHQTGTLNWNHIPIKNTEGYNNSGYGLGSWNYKLNKLLIMECDGNGRYIPVIWNDCIDFRKYALEGQRAYASKEEKYTAYSNKTHDIKDYFDNATFDNTTYERFRFPESPQGYSSASEALYRGVPILCDNGKIVMFTMHPGYTGTGGFSCVRWNESGQVETGGQTPSPTADHQLFHKWRSNWTMYGYEHGAWLGIKWQMSSDGRYVWAYCPEYYYGAGMYLGICRVSDGKVIFMNSGSHDYGYSAIPVGKSSLMIFQQWNTDSAQGAYHKMHDLDMWFSNWDDAYDWGEGLHNNYDSENFEAGGAYSTSYYCAIPAHYDTTLFSSPQIAEFD